MYDNLKNIYRLTQSNRIVGLPLIDYAENRWNIQETVNSENIENFRFKFTNVGNLLENKVYSDSKNKKKRKIVGTSIYQKIDNYGNIKDYAMNISSKLKIKNELPALIKNYSNSEYNSKTDAVVTNSLDDKLNKIDIVEHNIKSKNIEIKNKLKKKQINLFFNKYVEGNLKRNIKFKKNKELPLKIKFIPLEFKFNTESLIKKSINYFKTNSQESTIVHDELNYGLINNKKKLYNNRKISNKLNRYLFLEGLSLGNNNLKKKKI